MSHLPCVFFDSRGHERLSVDHPFYNFVNDTLQHVVKSTLVLRYMAQNTLQNEPLPDGAVMEQRVQEIIRYLKINCPTVSGSDSPTMYYPKTLVATRAYSGCGQDRKSRKLARKHVYIRKSLVDDWMELRSRPFSRGRFLLLTFLMKLCLLRGLVIAVQIAFMSEDIDVNDWTLRPPGPVHHSLSLFERLLCEWNVWLRFQRYPFGKEQLEYKYNLDRIIFKVGLCHVQISTELLDVRNKRTLLRLYVGDWTALPPLLDVPFMAFVEEGELVHIWDSPPAEDQNPREIETTPDEGDSSGCCVV